MNKRKRTKKNFNTPIGRLVSLIVAITICYLVGNLFWCGISEECPLIENIEMLSPYGYHSNHMWYIDDMISVLIGFVIILLFGAVGYWVWYG